MWYYVVLCGIVWYHAVLCGIMWHRVVLCGIALIMTPMCFVGVLQPLRMSHDRNEDMYVDGGVICNYPVYVFDGMHVFAG